MTFAKLLFASTVFAVGGCMGGPEPTRLAGFDLSLIHPAPYATYIQVVPGSARADLPDAAQIRSPEFSLYLRRATGCVRDAARPTEALGRADVPAGYMVPVVCP